MTRRLLYTLGAVLLLALVCVLTVWFLRTHEQVNDELAVPAYGEPTLNPLFALRQTLRRDGVDAHSRPRLALREMALQPTDTVVLLDDPRYLSGSDARALLAWVSDGGHLVLRTPPGRDDGEKPGVLLSQLGVALVRGTTCYPWQTPGDNPHSEFCRGRQFVLSSGTAPAVRLWRSPGDPARLGYARLGHGQGYVDVLADLDFMLNTGRELRRGFDLGPASDIDGGLRDIAHRDLTRSVLAPNYGKGRMHLIYQAQRPSLWQWVLHKGWPVWAPLLLCLLGWMAGRAQRFGPWQPSPRPDRRSLLEHVRASGQHLLRYGRTPVLYDAARRAFTTRLRQRRPMLAALDGPDQAPAIAAELGLPPTLVSAALQAPPAADLRALRDRIALLIQMRNQL